MDTPVDYGTRSENKKRILAMAMIALVDQQKQVAKKLSLYKDRQTNIRLTTQALLNLIRQRLVEMNGEKV